MRGSKKNTYVKSQLQRWLLYVFLVANVITMHGCYGGDAKEVERNADSRYYTFDAATIFQLLDQGSLDIFTLLETTPQPVSQKPFVPSVTVSWTQADFLRVAQAVQQYIWEEPLGVLELSSMYFTLDCLDVDQGVFSMAVFTFYKVIRTDGEETRVQYLVRIIPSENLIRTSRAEFYPNIHIMIPIDLNQYPLTVEKALQMAEERGGTKERSEVDNSCMINAINESHGWKVLYQTWNEYRWEVIYSISIKP